MNTNMFSYSRKLGYGKLQRSLVALSVVSSLCLSQVVNAEVIWSEDFNAAELANKGAVFNTIDMDGVTAWSIDISAAELTATSDWFKVTNGVMEGRDLDGVAVWLSESIDIQGQTGVSVSVKAAENGTHEGTDFFDLAYSVDGGAFITLPNWLGNGDAEHTLVDDFTSADLSIDVPDGATLQLKVSMKNNSGSEYIRLDDIVVSSGNTPPDDGLPGDGEPGDGVPPVDENTITNACFNCPDLTKVANAADFVDSNYYADVISAINTEQETSVIRETISSTISTNHKQLTYSEVWTALTQTDEDPANTDNVILLYRGISIAKFSNGSGTQSTNPDNWNREHVWPKSHGFSSSSSRGYTDINHLRPTDISVNSSRGNLDFDNSDAPLSEAPENRVDSDSFEPRDVVKGDVARMVMYMDIRYEGSDGITPDLQVVDRLTTTAESKLGKLCTLLSWSESDPVDEYEQNRNSKIYEFQGNRNPFIDHPEWISTIYNPDCSGEAPADPEPTDPVDPPPTDPVPTDPEPTDPTPGADLFFSEYVEGGGQNKAVEIYNPTNATIDLTNYQFKLYSNGGTTPQSTYTLTGEILPNDVVVLGGNQIADDSPLKAYIDQFTSAVNFNGDDNVELVKGDIIIDNLGTYGVRVAWGKDVTLVRKPEVTSGDTNRDDGFSVANEWLVNSKDTFSFLGSHNANIDPVDPEDPIDPPTIGMCGDEADYISAIQGNGFTSPVVGETKIIEGVVTAVAANLKGYFVQEEAADTDEDASSSEAIFIYTNSSDNLPVVGSQIRLTGEVKENYGRTQLTVTEATLDCGQGEAIQAANVTLPIEHTDNWEALEGMMVSFTDELSVTDTYNLARYGQFSVSKGRLLKPTNVYAANSEQAIALADKNSRNRIMIDDKNNSQNPEFIPFPSTGLSYDNGLRLGDKVSGIYGVLDYSFSEYRVLPMQAPQFQAANARTSAPSFNGTGTLKVASFNVLNYFNGDGEGGGFPTARGADNIEEFVRQSEKIVAALVAIDADIVGLMELENDGFSATSAIAELVNQVNAQLGEGTYAYVSLNQASLGNDAITVGFIYKPASVALVGNAVTTSDTPFDFGNRQPLAQTFKEIANDEEFTVAVNHFKSKGCGSATGDNADQGDGQGCWNVLRTEAATGLMAWLNSAPTGSEDADILVIGDLNSYAKEDPINAFTDAGYVNLVLENSGVQAYSYSFGGELGYLDHAIASSSLNGQVVDATDWHINADEPRIFDYNTEYKSDTQLVNYYGSDAYRASDHDPVIVLLNLQSEVELIGDFDNDGDIDILDVREFSARLRRRESFDLSYDFNGDGVVNSRDVRAMMKTCTRSRCAV